MILWQSDVQNQYVSDTEGVGGGVGAAAET